jgi:hypothetical protein
MNPSAKEKKLETAFNANAIQMARRALKVKH